MSLRGDPEVFTSLTGKQVRTAHSGVDASGYGFVCITFMDGGCLLISEFSQTGEITVNLSE